MASLVPAPGKSKNAWRLFYTDEAKNRRSLYFCASKSHALAVKLHVENIIVSKRHSVPLEHTTQIWLNKLNEEFSEKLASAGLIEARSATRLIVFGNEYVDSRKDLKPGSTRNWRNTLKTLVDYFGADKDMRAIRVGDCDMFRQQLVNAGLAQATISKIVKQARQLFKAALRRGLIDANPFADIKAGTQRNEARMHFVRRDIINQLLKHVPNADWEMILVLCRYGGLRCPSEVLSLRWSDVKWADNEILVQSPKGEKYGKGVRKLPIFKELREPLQRAQAAAGKDTVYVVHHYRDSNNANLRTQLTRMLKKLGISQWPRLFHNLRASRETELLEKFPIQVVTAWLGNSPQIALQHYLQTTKEHFERALTEDTEL
jgi:integrase